jgi:hypothetical protein
MAQCLSWFPCSLYIADMGPAAPQGTNFFLQYMANAEYLII